MEHIAGVQRILNRENLDNKQVQNVVSEYRSLFDGATVESRQQHYTTVVSHYYDLVTDFYEYGWGDAFHFAVPFQGESYQQATLRHELYLALRMNVQKNQRVLDLGCGVGGPMRSIARFTGCRVTGVNLCQHQVNRAKALNAKCGLQDQCTLIKADFMHMPVEDNSFDHAYQIEAAVHTPNHVELYKEIFRVLKPGAYFAGYEWVLTDKYDPNNKEHQEVKKGVEIGNGLPGLKTGSEVVAALKEAGFEIVEVSDLAEDAKEEWYKPLSNNLTLRGFTRSPWGRWLGMKALGVLEKVHIAPKGSAETSAILNIGADSLVKGGQQKLFTPAMFTLVRKPLRE